MRITILGGFPHFDDTQRVPIRRSEAAGAAGLPPKASLSHCTALRFHSEAENESTRIIEARAGPFGSKSGGRVFRQLAKGENGFSTAKRSQNLLLRAWSFLP